MSDSLQQTLSQDQSSRMEGSDVLNQSSQSSSRDESAQFERGAGQSAADQPTSGFGGSGGLKDKGLSVERQSEGQSFSADAPLLGSEQRQHDWQQQPQQEQQQAWPKQPQQEQQQDWSQQQPQQQDWQQHQQQQHEQFQGREDTSDTQPLSNKENVELQGNIDLSVENRENRQFATLDQDKLRQRHQEYEQQGRDREAAVNREELTDEEIQRQNDELPPLNLRSNQEDRQQGPLQRMYAANRP